MTSRTSRAVVGMGLCMAVVLILAAGMAVAGPYQPCNVPPVVSSAARPNAMLVVDFSGSMQFPAYFDANFGGYEDSKVADCYSTSQTAMYDPGNQYYGPFDSDTYYVYDDTGNFFKPAETQPVQYYNGTADSEDGGSGTLWLTCEGSTFQVGDIVAVYDLSSNKSLNGDGHKVVEVAGARFRIDPNYEALPAHEKRDPAWTWNGKADPPGYKAVKRITGNLGATGGVSGNVLNLSVTSRTDAALQALIGGKVTTVSGDTTNVYIQAQGSRRFVSESTNVNAAFYVRPATLQSGSNYYPNDYDSGSYSSKDMFLSVSGRYRGQIDPNDPIKYDEQTEPWKFTLGRDSRVTIQLNGTWPNGNGCRLALYTDPSFTTLVGLTGTNVTSSSSHSITLEADLPAGTYYLRVAPLSAIGGTGWAYPYDLWCNVGLEKVTTLHSSAADHQGEAITKIGAIPWARVRIQVPAEQRKKQGLIQQSFSYVRFGFMYYNSDYKGKILVGCENSDLDTLLNAIQGVMPYNGTPTGEALREAYLYFKQDDSTTLNDAFIGAATSKDPYYGIGSSGTVPVPCRRSFVVLISDGEWNGTSADYKDPVRAAREMHVGLVGSTAGDLRTGTALPGAQTVDVYSIFAFSPAVAGENSMKAVGMYGSFRDATLCGDVDWPYSMTDYPSSSLSFTWPVSRCNDSAADCNPPGSCSTTPYYNVRCCKEWNSVWDRDNDGFDENKGSPDAYFKASNGKQLQAALAAVFSDVTSRRASASAVATVSQELREGDVIVRGVFEAADPDKVDSYLWRGHLEAFTPFQLNNEEIYSFEIPENMGLLCIDMSDSTRHCFDAGHILTTESTLTAWKVFTYNSTPQTGESYQQAFDKSNTWLTGSIDGSPDGVNRLGYLATSQSSNTQNLIDWVLGGYNAGWNLRDRSGWKIGETAQTTPWRLGDVVYSTPVVVGPPGLGEVSRRDPNIASFYTHRNNLIHRMKVIYVGANDGMLHAVVLGKYAETGPVGDTSYPKWIYDPSVDPEIGKELWSYIPSNLLTEFKPDTDGTGGIANTDYGKGGCVHRTMVDLAPRAWEVYINPTASRPDLSTNPCGSEADSKGRCWRTVLVGGERGGGDVYFAVDVTDPLIPIVLWEYPVLKNRVVQDAVESTESCEACYGPTTCSDGCETTRDTCWSACPSCEWRYVCTGYWWLKGVCNLVEDCSAQTACRSACTVTFNTCVNTCQTTCLATCQSYLPGAKYFVPLRNAYDSVKILPLSWSQPYLGRIEFPSGLQFYYGDPTPLDPVNGGSPDSAKVDQFTDDGSDSPDNRRAVVFMGGGIHLYDRDFDTNPAVDPRWKTSLFWPFLLMMDIETGHNLFEYVWPTLVNKFASTFPLRVAQSNTIPYAMADPVALDLWNQNDHSVGDDGFIDTVYVGDMNGYVYGIKFNFDLKKADKTTDNTDFGMQVDLWPTKPIETAFLDSNYYRDGRQPITLSIAATFEKGSTDSLNVLFGTGKYDDMEGGWNDKTDTALMSLYNIRDTIAMPDLSGTDNVYQVVDTAFKVRLNPKCPDAMTSSTFFNTSCTWAKLSDVAAEKTTICSDPGDLATCVQTADVANSPDCCERGNSDCSNPCYRCVYDFVLPEDSALPGERVVGKPLIAGGLAFLTTFVPPSDPCGWTGTGYLYAFGVDCVPLLDPNSIFNDPDAVAVGAISSGTATAPSGIRLPLGSGVPSRPVLDSRGENIVIQMSDGTLKRKPVKLPGKPINVKGWRSR